MSIAVYVVMMVAYYISSFTRKTPWHAYSVPACHGNFNSLQMSTQGEQGKFSPT